MVVDDVPEEYAFVRAQSCEACGCTGSYDVKLQSLVRIDGAPHDVLDCKCKECGAEKSFTFDVTRIFARYDEIFKQ
ncbi:MAG: hypothetical protein GYA24_20450 [Candidatus Lokiarchaeota archaeon]|nr:hypothetical protein [Candidatus Lokiarchaeota archaeon]